MEKDIKLEILSLLKALMLDSNLQNKISEINKVEDFTLFLESNYSELNKNLKRVSILEQEVLDLEEDNDLYEEDLRKQKEIIESLDDRIYSLEEDNLRYKLNDFNTLDFKNKVDLLIKYKDELTSFQLEDLFKNYTKKDII